MIEYTPEFVDQVVSRTGRGPDAVIPILQALQDHYGYLPALALRRISEITEIRPSAITGVATFYGQFRHRPVGRHVVRVCRGTACHVSGADRIENALRLRLGISKDQDTDAAGEYTLETVACLGCCTLAPVVQLDRMTYGYMTAEKWQRTLEEFSRAGSDTDASLEAVAGTAPAGGSVAEIRIGLGSCCVAKGSEKVYRALQQTLHQRGCAVNVKRVGCVGMCHRTPLIELSRPGQPGTFYAGIGAERIDSILTRHFPKPRLLSRCADLWSSALDRLLDADGNSEPAAEPAALDPKAPEVAAFLDPQRHIATEHFGRIDPLDLDEYLGHDGFAGLRRCLGELSPEEVIGTIERSGLRGRGGAGFPSGQKWRRVLEQTEPVKYVICNGDEGDPGAFMDRMILESFPFRVIEGLAIAAWAVGSHDGIFYIRHEYPLAVRRIRAAIRLCEQRGWLGQHLLGTDYPLRLTIKEGAGAFVCGEETALIASVEGRRGMPRLRPPFPAQSGLWGKPTLVNNVETLALVPWILRHGPEAFAALGTATSKGTKVFALAGKVQRGGLIEVPMGMTIRQIVEEIGGGVAPGRRFKAVQIGGPSGGCVPARLAETPVDYESLRGIGAVMGSGGLVVLDNSDCMVDIARYFLQFTQDQSCGKCTFCRIGTKRMLDVLDRLCTGRGQKDDLSTLEQLAHWVSRGSLCGLGKTAPNPVLTTLRYFRDEYEAHLAGRCPARKCQALIRYQITDDCTGCTLCAQHCPVRAIPLAPYQKHTIDQALCTRCDTCRRVCPHQAIEVN